MNGIQNNFNSSIREKTEIEKLYYATNQMSRMLSSGRCDLY